VSRVVNGSSKVSCETRSKVLSAIARLQYCPNPHAAELGRASGDTRRKGIGQLPNRARAQAHSCTDSGSDDENKRLKAQRLRLLEEHSRLRQQVAELRADLELWRSIVEDFEHVLVTNQPG
jgi:transposase